MSRQAGILISFGLLMFGETIYYLNEEYPEKATLARFGLGIAVLGLLVLGGEYYFPAAVYAITPPGGRLIPQNGAPLWRGRSQSA